jgi:hypothetical protein
VALSELEDAVRVIRVRPRHDVQFILPHEAAELAERSLGLDFGGPPLGLADSERSNIQQDLAPGPLSRSRKDFRPAVSVPGL